MPKIIENLILQKINEKYHPAYLELENESHQHAGGPNRETHFRLLIVSDDFKSMTRVQRSRDVHDLLATEFKSGVHALSLRTYSVSEWESLDADQKKMISPRCHGHRKI